jgi:hypothetical protein
MNISDFSQKEIETFATAWLAEQEHWIHSQKSPLFRENPHDGKNWEADRKKYLEERYALEATFRNTRIAAFAILEARAKLLESL